MIIFEKSNILSTHLKDGALQGVNVFKKDGLELLNGFVVLKNKKEMTLKKGWYNSNLNFFGKITDSEQVEISEILIF